MSNSALDDAIAVLASNGVLTREMSRDAIGSIIDGDGGPAQIAAFLTALHFRGIEANGLVGAALAVRARMTPFPISDEMRPILDTCGTGGDGVNSVNISTASALVVAACGVRVAKHGNRSASGNSGSSEVLSELGVNVDADPRILNRCLGELGITFLFAPNFHGALKHAAPIRKILPFRTIFNLIGPLVNPSKPDHQVIGVPDREKAQLIRTVYRELSELESSAIPRSRAFVISADSGLDEVSLSGTTYVYPTWGYDPAKCAWRPEDFGLPLAADEALKVSGPADSASKIRAMLAGERGPVRDVVLANASVALNLVKKVDTLSEGVALASETIDRGEAKRLLGRWAAMSHSKV